MLMFSAAQTNKAWPNKVGNKVENNDHFSS